VSGLYLLDTNVFGEIGRDDGDAVVLKWLETINRNDIRVASLTWGELSFGVNKLQEGRKRRALVHWLDMMIDLYREATLSFDLESSQIWGRLKAELLLKGTTKPLVDLQIAAIALRHGLPVVTRNTKHFEGLGLVVINPWSDEAIA
jgi:predicted nucleic acid-binding protein